MNHVGIGYDVHQLVEGRKLVLGGVEIPHEKGLDGHSDADELPSLDKLMNIVTDADMIHAAHSIDLAGPARSSKCCG